MPTSQSKRLGNLVRKARLAKGLSTRVLADATTIDHSTISRLENGEIEHPRVKTLQRLSRTLDMPIEELYSLAGYARRESLPELPIYLRSKYNLSANQIAELETHFDRLRAKRGGR